MTDQTINVPNAPVFLTLPENHADALAMLRVAGISLIGPAVRWMEANDPANLGKWMEIHEYLNQAGYAIKELTGVDVGAGGSGKGGGGGGGGGGG